MKFALIFIPIFFFQHSPWCQNHKTVHKHSISLEGGGYLWTPEPSYTVGDLNFASKIGVTYKWTPIKYGNIGIGIHDFFFGDHEYGKRNGHFAVHSELNSRIAVSAETKILLGIGLIAHKEAAFFHPMVFPTAHFLSLIEPNGTRLFIELGLDIIWAYGYKRVKNTQSQFPAFFYLRDGWRGAVGLHLAAGTYL